MEIVSFEIAKKLKEKEYPQEPKSGVLNQYYEWDGLRNIHPLYVEAVWYESENKEYLYSAPTISQVLEWLRGKKIYVSVEVEREDWFEYKIVQTIKNTRKTGTRVYETYPEAILAGIEYVIDNLI